MKFFEKLGWQIKRFMYGRYGTDTLNLVLIVAAFCAICLAETISYTCFTGVNYAGVAAHVFPQYCRTAAGK